MEDSMKKIAFILIAMVVLSSFALAGDDTSPKTKQGDKAWMFTFNGLSNLGAGNYMGGAGIKYYIQDNLALRGGVGFYTMSVSGATNNPTNFGVNAGIEYVYSTLGATAAYVGAHVSFLSEKPSPYLGAGNTETASTIGVAAVAGVNWFMWDNVSLQPEYQLGFSSVSPGGGGNSATTVTIASTGQFVISWFF